MEKAELQIRVLYAVWKLEEDGAIARATVEACLAHIPSDPTSEAARSIKLWLTMASLVASAYIYSDDNSTMIRLTAAISAWDEAFNRKFSEVIAALPARLN